MDFLKKLQKKVQDVVPEGVDLKYTSFNPNNEQASYDNSELMSKLSSQNQQNTHNGQGNVAVWNSQMIENNGKKGREIWKDEDEPALKVESEKSGKPRFLDKFKNKKVEQQQQEENQKYNFLNLDQVKDQIAEKWCINKILEKKGVFTFNDFQLISSQFVLLDCQIFGSMIIYKLLENIDIDEKKRILSASIFIARQSKEYFNFFRHNFKILKNIQVPPTDFEDSVKNLTKQFLYMFKDHVPNFDQLVSQNQAEDLLVLDETVIEKKQLILVDDIIAPIQLDYTQADTQSQNHKQQDQQQQPKKQSGFPFLKKQLKKEETVDLLDQQNQPQVITLKYDEKSIPLDLTKKDEPKNTQKQKDLIDHIDVLDLYKLNGNYQPLINKNPEQTKQPSKTINAIEQIDSLLKDFKLDDIPDPNQKAPKPITTNGKDPFDFISF